MVRMARFPTTVSKDILEHGQVLAPQEDEERRAQERESGAPGLEREPPGGR